MTRRTLFAGLLAMVPLLGKSETRKKWYIVGGRRATQTDCDVEPIISYGADRLEAIANSGITVASEEEWQRLNYAKFQEGCKARKAQ